MNDSAGECWSAGQIMSEPGVTVIIVIPLLRLRAGFEI
jgi:hypothetical protein